MDYAPEVVRRFNEAPHAGPTPAGPGALVRGEAGSMEQGTWVVFHARIEGTRVADLRFEVYGCPHTIAACSLVAEMLSGGPARNLAQFDPLGLMAPLGVPPEKTGRLLIIQDALRNCLADWDNSPLRVSP